MHTDTKVIIAILEQQVSNILYLLI